MKPPVILHWTAYVIGSIAMLTLLISEGSSFILPVILVGFLATAYFPQRFGDQKAPVWMLRLALWGIIISLDLARPVTGTNGYFDSRLNWTGELLAAELMIQSWRRKSEGGGRGIAIMLLSGLVFLIACNVQDEAHTSGRALPYLLYIAPIFMLFLILSLRHFGDPEPMSSIRQLDREAALRAERAMRAFRISGAILILLALGIGVGIHLSFRRFRAELTAMSMRMLSERQWRTNGLSTSPRLGRTFGMRGTTERIFLIHGAFNNAHWRAVSFDTYREGIWGPPRDGRKRTKLEILRNPGVLTGAKSGISTSIPLTVSRLSENSGLLCAPLNTVALDPQDNASFQWAKDEGPATVTYQPLNDYAVDLSQDEQFQGPFCVPPSSPKLHDKLLSLPENLDDGVRKLADKIVGAIPATQPLQRVRAIESYLLAHYAYSLQYDPGSGDPVTSFLLHGKSAHCEYFASSAVILARCARIPARYVIGFYAHESDGAGNTVVRGRDAHAWAECWIEGVGWVTIDGTPPSGRPDELNGPIPGWQRGLERFQDVWNRFQVWVGGPNGIKAAGVVGGIVFCLLGWQWWQQSRRSTRLTAETISYVSPDVELATLLNRFVRLCQSRGMVCPPQQTWLEYLQTVRLKKLQGGEVKAGRGRAKPEFDIEHALKFLNLYNIARFGPSPTHIQLQELRETLDSIGTS